MRRAVSSPPSPSAAAWATATRSRCAGEGGSEGHNRRAALERQQRVTGMRPDCPKCLCVRAACSWRSCKKCEWCELQ